MSETSNVNNCIYNQEVRCNVANCAVCGWNPEVAAKRDRARRIAKMQAKLPDHKLYKLSFTGHCEVWARSPEDAVEAASNEDMFFVRYEFEEPIRLTQEG